MPWIYKISNDINNKIYIGYTRYTPEKRFNQHWSHRFSDNSYLHKAMIKYGKEHFFVTGIEEVTEEEGFDKEQYYIKQYNCKVPFGYNLTDGGENPPIQYGSKNNKSKLTDEEFFNLIQDLREYQLDFGQIAKKYKISQSQVERINQGKFRFQKDLEYPIRTLKKDQYIIKCIIEDLKNTNLTQEEIEEKYQIKSRTRLYDINWGKVGKKLFPQESYPLRVGIKNQKPKYLSNPVETILVIEE